MAVYKNILLSLNTNPTRSRVRPTHAIKPMQPIVDPDHVVGFDFLSVSIYPCPGMTGVGRVEIGSTRKMIVKIVHFGSPVLL
jgi:hypothetical protein